LFCHRRASLDTRSIQEDTSSASSSPTSDFDLLLRQHTAAKERQEKRKQAAERKREEARLKEERRREREKEREERKERERERERERQRERERIMREDQARNQKNMYEEMIIDSPPEIRRTYPRDQGILPFPVNNNYQYPQQHPFPSVQYQHMVIVILSIT
jgi:septal ring factor EnvC (AmiA/AmiB activator)